MYRSLHEVVLAHDDHVAVHPTHGAGSLCATDIASTPTSTIGYEKRHNQLLHAADVEAFVRRLLRGQPAVPRYFARMRPDEPGGARPPRRARPGAAAARPRGDAARDRGRRPAPRPPAPGRARGVPRARVAVDPARAELRDVARLGRRPGAAAGPDPRAGVRLGRGDPPGPPDRRRDRDPRPSPRRVRDVGRRRRGAGSQRPTERRPARRANSPAAARRRPSSSTSGRPTSTRWATSRAAS